MPPRTEQFIVETSQPGVRLDTYLRSRFAAVSRGTMQRLIEAGHIQVNGHATKATVATSN